MKLLSLIAIIMSFVSCTAAPEQPSILLIAVDSLHSDIVTCPEHEGNEESGFRSLCQESVRFTHAYTTSTMGQAAMSSILTGLYPYKTRVRDNGSQFLSSEFQTIAEVARKKNYETAFFSGGTPIFRRSGFGQGFQMFDDGANLNQNQLYKNSKELVANFLNWLRRDVNELPFLSVIYVADLQFPGVTVRGQIQELDENINVLVKGLKERGRWDNTLVILVGLNGLATEERAGELPGTNLFTENSQVALLMKPVSKKRDLGLNWKVDTNVNMADLGLALYEVLGESPLTVADEELPVVSLNHFLNTKSNVPDRWLLIESGWPAWQKYSGIRSVFLHDQFLVFWDDVPRAYNTLVDRMQSVPLGAHEANIMALFDQPSKIASALHIASWTPIASSALRELGIQREWARSPNSIDVMDRLRDILEDSKTSSTLVDLGGLSALERKDWKQLKRLGDRFKKRDWTYLAVDNLSTKKVVDNSKNLSGCLSFLIGQSESCDNTMAVDLKQGLADPQLQNAAFERFLRSYKMLRLKRKIAQANLMNGLIWSVQTENVMAPHVTDIFLSLQQNSRFKMVVEKRIELLEEGSAIYQ